MADYLHRKFDNQGCLSIYLTPILFRESFSKDFVIKSLSSGEAETSSEKMISPLYMLFLSSV